MSVNKVIIVGRLGQDPEIRSTAGGASVANFSVATSESWTDKSGQKQERTEWHRIVVWGKLADLCKQYLSKGRQVYIEGRLQTRQWQDKDGQNRYTTEVQAQTVQFLGGASASAGAGASAGNYGSGASYGGGNNYAQSGGSSDYGMGASAPGMSGPEPSFTEDDVPF